MSFKQTGRFRGSIKRLLSARNPSGAGLNQLVDLDRQRVETINQLVDLDRQRVETINQLLGRLVEMDGITAAGRNRSFLADPVFAKAWQHSAEANAEGWPDGVPDVRWRAHIAVWAARRGLVLEGDFVECGVHTGLLSLTICHALDFSRVDKRFHLFDTFAGIPIETVETSEAERVAAANARVYRDVYDIAVRNFSPFPNAKLVRGLLPDTLSGAQIGRIAYLSVDLNNVQAERGVITELWERLTTGAAVLVDDYDWTGCERQQEMWDTFAHTHGTSIACLPTGQGLLIKP